MNKGLICVSVIAETAAELAGLMDRAAAAADVVELRFDALDEENIRIAFHQLVSEKQVLVTMRPKKQGGVSDRDLVQRIGFWMGYALHKEIDFKKVWIDHEYDLAAHKEVMFWVTDCFVIRSRHYFDGEIPDLEKAYAAVVSDAEVGKVAVTAKEATDAIGIWKLLERANSEGKRLIPIAMGEAGKWTRILGPAYGAFMTYAAIESGGETAPGQISAADMAEVFRVRDLDRDTNVYGVIAGNTSYSVSPWMHNAAFAKAGVNSVFIPLQVTDLDAFMTRMVLPATREVDLNFKGFSVTNPHKQSIIPYLDEIDETAAAIGAVNTVKIEDGKLLGFNTDAFGFISTLEQAFGDLKDAKAAVFGAGGAARACIHTLKEKGAGITIFARNEDAGQRLAEGFGADYVLSAGDGKLADDGFDIVVNTTPLGTIGSNSNFAVLTRPQLEGIKMVYDLVYNPAETRLIREAKAAGAKTLGGMEMVIAQGAKQFEIWTGNDAPVEEMTNAVRKKLGL